MELFWDLLSGRLSLISLYAILGKVDCSHSERLDEEVLKLARVSCCIFYVVVKYVTKTHNSNLLLEVAGQQGIRLRTSF